MSIIRRFDPFQELGRMENEFQKVFDNFFGDRTIDNKERVYAPLVDLRDDKKSFILDIDLPGFEKDEIKIEVTRESVEIIAEHKKEKESNKEGDYLHKERFAYKFKRQIGLPSPINTEKITSSFKNGTLTLTLGKEEGSLKKTIIIS